MIPDDDEALTRAVDDAVDCVLARMRDRGLRGLPQSAADIADLAERAIRKIDLWGPRGVTTVSIAEIDAMACVIVAVDAIALVRARLTAPQADPIPEGDPT